MTDVISTALSDTVGNVASSLDDPSLCFWPLTQAFPLTLPSRFYFKNISDSRASSFSLSLRSPAASGKNVLFMWSWCKCFGYRLFSHFLKLLQSYLQGHLGHCMVHY